MWFLLVICRIGSLEIRVSVRCQWSQVICRIGSLERTSLNLLDKWECYLPYRQLRNDTQPVPMPVLRYLPYRQLRNLKIRLFYVPIRYLLYRQLRNPRKYNQTAAKRYLPYRQFRKHSGFCRYSLTGYLPYRQFRKYEKYVDESKKGYLPYRQVIYFIVLFLWLTSDRGRLFVLRGWCCRAYVAKWGAFLSGAVFPVL